MTSESSSTYPNPTNQPLISKGSESPTNTDTDTSSTAVWVARWCLLIATLVVVTLIATHALTDSEWPFPRCRYARLCRNERLNDRLQRIRHWSICLCGAVANAVRVA